MGNKTHPVGFRLGITSDWKAKWFADKQKEYRGLVKEDMAIRKAVTSNKDDAGISRVDIERGSNDVVITIHTARPGIVIGRGGQKVEELRKELEKLTSRRIRLNIQDIRQAELDAYLVARNIADQLERRVAFRRAIKQAVTRTMQSGAKGIKVVAGGRLGGGEIARTEKAMEGRVPLHTLRADIDFAIAEAHTGFGRIGVKVWIFKGEVLPQRKQVDAVTAALDATSAPAKTEQEGTANAAAKES
ncbi:MAG: 30S ribosomal protein S3 [SAR202 cluster bacterium]|nr:30S ribosomal protein S3 [SAR202 cluster bacterium]